ncbi:MAG: helix-turn-helix domain-containing protein [Sciscionella sp.]
MAGTSGTPKAQTLGSRLKEARLAAGYKTTRELASRLKISHSTISRWETGARYPKPEDVATILAATGVNGADRDKLLEMARGTNDSHWLAVRSADRELQMAALLEFEAKASLITDVSPLLIPGLLQTREYTRAIMVAGGVPESQVETRVTVRLGRRDALARPNPVHLLALIGEPALYQLIGDPKVMRDQLTQVVTYAERPNVDVRVIPNAVNWNPSLDGPFVLVDSADEPSIVHLENRRAGLFFHESDDVEAYRRAAETVKEMAMSPADSQVLIADIITRLETTL